MENEDMYYFIYEGDHIIYRYDEYTPWVDELPDYQSCLKVAKNDLPKTLPVEWYYRITCPEYIKVITPVSFNRIEQQLNKTLSANIMSITEGDNILFKIDIMHNKYTDIVGGENLGFDDVDKGVTVVEPGIEKINTTAMIKIDEYNIESEFVNGHCEIILKWEKEITNTNVVITLGQKTIYSFCSIELPESVKYKMSKNDFIAERNYRLSQCDWIITRHISQKMLSDKTTLSDEEARKVAQYMQDLRDLPEHTESYKPDDINWPVFPLTEEQAG